MTDVKIKKLYLHSLSKLHSIFSSVVQPEHVVRHCPGAAQRGQHEGLAELERVGLSLGL